MAPNYNCFQPCTQVKEIGVFFECRLKVQVEKRLEALNSDIKEKGKAPARPPPPIHVNSQKKIPHSYIPTVANNDQGSVQSWEDARELFSVGNSMFNSSQ